MAPDLQLTATVLSLFCSTLLHGRGTAGLPALPRAQALHGHGKLVANGDGAGCGSQPSARWKEASGQLQAGSGAATRIGGGRTSKSTPHFL